MTLREAILQMEFGPVRSILMSNIIDQDKQLMKMADYWSSTKSRDRDYAYAEVVRYYSLELTDERIIPFIKSLSRQKGIGPRTVVALCAHLENLTGNKNIFIPDLPHQHTIDKNKIILENGMPTGECSCGAPMVPSGWRVE